ncbi:unnamed protein product, partial [Mesorhabditis belari]|uniref:Uncharacterized protein n=1 Tax=Mesorhabditis belari TaxID=2138241 RepID=A0AAF3FGZ0_9BILA
MKAFPILCAVLFAFGAYFSIVSAVSDVSDVSAVSAVSAVAHPESLTVIHVALCDVNCTVGSCYTCCTINQYPQGGICMNLWCYCN